MKRYDIILCDPPWKYNNRMTGKKKDGTTRDTGAASNHYSPMSLAQLIRLPVRQLAAKDSLLFMWSTGPFMIDAMALIKGWGFTYKTMAFVWDKNANVPGSYTMSRCEFCLVSKIGKIPQPRGARNVKQYLQKKRTRHSEKPHDVYERIELMFPSQSKIELFARNKRPGWDSWGDQITCDINLEELKK
tara:strand:+ start:285 stop:848 length:564 start_codon:yes stop_codon:yes gene_type:complete